MTEEIGFTRKDAKDKAAKISPIEIFKLASYVRPVIKEVTSTKYVLNGDKNSFYQEIIDRYNGSPTHRTIIDNMAKFIYGKGLYSKEASKKPLQFAIVQSIFSKKDVRGVCFDKKLYGEFAYELIYKGGKLKKAKHISKNMVLPSLMTEEGEILSYWYSMDFSQATKARFKPVEIEAWYEGGSKNGSYIYVGGEYQPGKTYFTDPDYLPCMPYAKFEEEQANYSVNHIQNGLSVGHIINMNNGEPESEEVKVKTAKRFKDAGTGSGMAGSFLLNFNEPDKGIDVIPLEVSEAHKQYETLADISKQMIIIGHKVVSPILVGIKDNTGFGNNAEEMQVAYEKYMTTVVQPIQEEVIDHHSIILVDAGYTIKLDFRPLMPITVVKDGVKVEMSATEEEEVETDEIIADALIECGEVIDLQEWEDIDTRVQEGKPQLNEITLTLASVPSSFPAVSSEQDTELFKVRYEYAGSQNPQRSFCSKMMGAGKVYRKEDIDLAATKVVNPGFGPKGTNTYDIWLYKGGPNCKHFWQRRIYLRRNNERITAAQARQIINALEPSDRKLQSIKVNNPLVAKLPYDMPNHGYLSGKSKKSKK